MSKHIDCQKDYKNALFKKKNSLTAELGMEYENYVFSGGNQPGENSSFITLKPSHEGYNFVGYNQRNNSIGHNEYERFMFKRKISDVKELKRVENYLYIENTFRKNKGKYKKSYYYKSLKRESIRLSKKYKNKYIDSQKYKYQVLDVEVENEFGMKKFKDYKMKKQEKNYREDKLKEQKQLFNPIELRLIQLITTGFTFEEAAEEIGISSDNARKMKCNIYSKINKRICS